MNEIKKSSPKDVFLHLLSIITLYISAGSLTALLFQYINILLPDPLAPAYYFSVAGPIRWSMASLIIVFPIYIFISWLLNRDCALNPEKRELKIRKWLVHFTLFLAAVIIAGDLVSLVYNFLGGDLTARFFLKIAAILIVTGTIFGYYLLDLKQKMSGGRLKILAWLVSLVVLIGVIAGFFTAGSPFKARLYKFDERRINDLQILQNEIINYWVQKVQLPATLSDLVNNITGFTPPFDPATGVLYEYKITNDELVKPSFELCAVFNLASEITVGRPKEMPYPATPYGYSDPYGYQQNWAHESGRQCFSRTIDPELYRDRTGKIKM